MAQRTGCYHGGTTTALVDNPSLTNRLWYGKSPLRIVIDRKARLPESLAIFSKDAQTVAYADHQYIDQHPLKDTYRPLHFNDKMLSSILDDLYMTEKVRSILIEGGPKLLQSFIDKGLWDEARISTSPFTWVQVTLHLSLKGNRFHWNIYLMMNGLYF